MRENLRLSHDDREHFLVAVETSLRINKRPQFYLWAQGALQGFLAHETLLCVYGDIHRMKFRYESFSGCVPGATLNGRGDDIIDGLLPRLVDDWLRHGCTPRMSCPEGDGQLGRRQLLTDLKRAGFGHLAAHGTREMQGEFGSFFVFAGQPDTPGPRDAYFLELLMPYLHLALHRMLMHENNADASEGAPTILLSKREIQVLHWVKNGKTNQEIGQILSISATTAKNHVQNIMRKLNVTNRAQAVGKSATLRLIAPGES